MILNRLVPTHPHIEQSSSRLALPLRPLPHSTISGLLERGTTTTTVATPSYFYTDNTSSLNSRIIRSTM
ncbi:hypothetical protein IC575_001742 [Cucumis melo]